MHALPTPLGFVSDRVYIHGICSVAGCMGNSHSEMVMIGEDDGVIPMREGSDYTRPLHESRD